MKWTTRSLWWRGPLLRGLDRLHRWYILRYCPLSKRDRGPNPAAHGRSPVQPLVGHSEIGGKP